MDRNGRAGWRGMTVRRGCAECLMSIQTPLGRLETLKTWPTVSLLRSVRRFMTGQGINVTGGVYMG